jgi:hypothetical protein
MNIFVVLVALLTLCNLATFLLSLPSNLMAEKRDARRESSATNKTTLLTVADSSVEQKNAPYVLFGGPGPLLGKENEFFRCRFCVGALH